jgi:hypothetical protein
MRVSIDCILLGVAALLGVYDGMRVLRLPVFVPEPLGSGFYLIGVASLLFFAVVLESGLHPVNRIRADRERIRKLSSLLRKAEILAWLALVLYVVLLEAIGYFLSTLSYLMISIRIFGERRWLWLMASGGALTFIFYMLFQKLAGIPLP